ncbi:hypothetical protein PTI45_02722 [Paenibacillus nuruki]|uniref:Uncharacterized protein n=1 Tax=Paenibacillus nuruki TaxID=1886670 RepID=A0A1E3L2M2_9BACL|nr:hypothetical protein PTI45_02722 [Paenibacillus nuruki]
MLRLNAVRTGLKVERTARFASIRVNAEGDALLEKVINP